MPLLNVEMCWMSVGVPDLGLAPSSCGTLKDLSLGSWGLGLALGSSVCPTEPPAHISLFWPCGSCLVAGRHVDLCNGSIQRQQKPLVFPGWEFSISFIYRVMLGELIHPVMHLVLVLLISHSLSLWHVGSPVTRLSQGWETAVLVPNNAEWASIGLGNESPQSFYLILNLLEEEQNPSRLWFDIRWWIFCSCKACSTIENSVPLC